MEFLDISLRKYSSPLLHAIHSPSYWRSLKKTRIYSWIAFYRTKNEGRKPDKKLESEETSISCIETTTKNSVQEFHLWCPLFFIPFSIIFIDEFQWTFPTFASDPFDKQCATSQGRRFSQSAICLGAVSVWPTDDRLCWSLSSLGTLLYSFTKY